MFFDDDVEELEAEHTREVDTLEARVHELEAEVERLLDGIATHRSDVLEDLQSEEDALPADSRLWDVLGDR